jgi:hypothetical protein
MRTYTLLLFLFFSSALIGQEAIKLMEQGFTEEVTVDLRNPLFSDGILTTEEGGVAKGPNFRLQALKIKYTKKEEQTTVEAEEQLIVEFGEYVFVGDRIFYDFQKKEGVIFNGRTGIEPWYIGGERIELRPDGTYYIYNGFFTTSENVDPEWVILAQEAVIEEKQYFKAQRVHLKLGRFSVLGIPSLRANLNSIFDSPIRYRFRWGGKQGPRFGLTYEVFSWERWKTFARFDYRLTRGPGGGIETYYRSLDHRTEFQSINYLASDSSLSNPGEKARFRFEGRFSKLMPDNKTSILMTYDKLSDIDMPGDSIDKDFDLDTSERTQLLVRHQEEDWINIFYTRVRVNSFQTVKQELPTFSTNFRPFVLGNTGIIFENWANASYLNFKYAKNIIHVHDYDSTRFEYRPLLYRTFLVGPLNVMPEAGGISIFYGDSPEHDAQWLLSGLLGTEVNTQLYRFYGPRLKHVIEPYIRYRYYTSPTSSPDDHYIFDISDGWYRLNMLTFGVSNVLYAKNNACSFFSPWAVNVYAHAFFNTPTIKSRIPKVYGELILNPNASSKYIVNTAWDLQHQQLDHINLRSEWTMNADFAVAAEFRHRSKFSWRKVDPDNFFLEAYRSEESLLHSAVSDRRDTFLLHLFYRFHPKWACEISSRHGWNRRFEPDYTEYEIDLLTTIRTAWNLKIAYQHRENDDRIALYNIGLKRPDIDSCPIACPAE